MTEYVVEVRYSLMPIPLSLFVHTYLVIKHGQNEQRYEMIAATIRTDNTPIAKNIYRDFLAPTTGLRVFGLLPEHGEEIRFKSKLYSQVSGTKNSPAHLLYTFIKSERLLDYPNKNLYSMLRGPNSNTFVQWVVDQVPECNLSLPWNAWGKGYKSKT